MERRRVKTKERRRKYYGKIESKETKKKGKCWKKCNVGVN